MKIPTYDAQLSYIKAMPQPTGLGHAVAGVGKVLTDIGAHFVQKLRQNREMLQFAKAQTDLVNAYNDFKLELAKDPDYLNHPKKFTEFWRPQFEQIMNGITEPNAQQHFSLWAEKERTRYEHDVEWNSHKIEVKDQLIQYENYIEEAIKRDDINGIIAVTQGLVSNASILESQGQEVIEKARHKIAFNKAKIAVKGMDYNQAKEWLADPENTEGLSTDEILSLDSLAWSEYGRRRAYDRDQFDIALGEATSQLVEAYESRRLNNDVVDAILDYKKIDPNNVDPDAVAEERLRWYGFADKLAKTMQAGGAANAAKSDPNALKYLDSLIWSDAPWADKKKIVDDYYFNGQLSRSDYKGYMNELDTKRGDGDYYVDSGLKKLDQAIKDGKLSEEDGNLIKNNYRYWIMNHPDASPKEVIAITDDFIEGIPREGGLFGWFPESQEDYTKKIIEKGSEFLTPEQRERWQEEQEKHIKDVLNKFDEYILREIEEKAGLTRIGDIVTSKWEDRGRIEGQIDEEKRALKKGDMFQYSTGEIGMSLTDIRTEEKRYYMYKNGEWQPGFTPDVGKPKVSKATAQNDMQRFKSKFGGWDEILQNPETGEVHFVKNGKEYRYKNGQLQVYQQVAMGKKWVTLE